MASFQSIVEGLLLDTGASRAMLQIADPGGGFPVLPRRSPHGARQLRNDGSEPVLLDASALEQLERQDEIVVQDDLERADPPARAV